MGVGVALSEMFGTGGGLSKLVGINRAFFMQGLLLVSICRRLPDPPPGQSAQEAALKLWVAPKLYWSGVRTDEVLYRMLKDVMQAVQEGAKENAEKPGVKHNVEAQFLKAKQGLIAYIDGYGVALVPDRWAAYTRWEDA